MRPLRKTGEKIQNWPSRGESKRVKGTLATFIKGKHIEVARKVLSDGFLSVRGKNKHEPWSHTSERYREVKDIETDEKDEEQTL